MYSLIATGATGVTAAAIAIPVVMTSKSSDDSTNFDKSFYEDKLMKIISATDVDAAKTAAMEMYQGPETIDLTEKAKISSDALGEHINDKKGMLDYTVVHETHPDGHQITLVAKTKPTAIPLTANNGSDIYIDTPVLSEIDGDFGIVIVVSKGVIQSVTMGDGTETAPNIVGLPFMTDEKLMELLADGHIVLDKTLRAADVTKTMVIDAIKAIGYGEYSFITEDAINISADGTELTIEIAAADDAKAFVYDGFESPDYIYPSEAVATAKEALETSSRLIRKNIVNPWTGREATDERDINTVLEGVLPTMDGVTVNYYVKHSSVTSSDLTAEIISTVDSTVVGNVDFTLSGFITQADSDVSRIVYQLINSRLDHHAKVNAKDCASRYCFPKIVLHVIAGSTVFDVTVTKGTVDNKKGQIAYTYSVEALGLTHGIKGTSGNGILIGFKRA